jgi:hypothetical protein
VNVLTFARRASTTRHQRTFARFAETEDAWTRSGREIGGRKHGDQHLPLTTRSAAAVYALGQ